MSDPLLVNELEDESFRDQFNDLLEAMNDIATFDPNREEGAYEALNQHVLQTVTDNPILARIVNESNISLLAVACANLNLDTSHHVIKCLIRSYPVALLGTSGDYIMYRPIYMISRHPEHCVLLPWIASNYTWVLDHERCPRVVFKLLQMYGQRQRTSCTATTMKDFFQAYPRALTQKDYGENVLHVILQGTQECEADLFKWIAERCPSSYLLEKDYQGLIPLHLACIALSQYEGSDSYEICKCLIRICPESVRTRALKLNGDGDILKEQGLPIHFLQGGCRHRLAREFVVCLLREHPESYDIPHPLSGRGLPSSNPFIQSIKPHLDEEKELKETVASLKESTSSLTKAVTCTNDQLMRSAFTVFDSWATSYINSTEDKLQLISTRLQDLCNEGRESDE